MWKWERSHLQIVDLVKDVIPDSGQVAPLQVGIHVNLYNAVGDLMISVSITSRADITASREACTYRLAILVLCRTRAAVKHEEHRLGLGATKLLRDKLLVFAEKFGVQLHVSGRV